ncbi:Dynactin subunit 2, partial [Caligus rogercresseyi]
TEDLPEADQHIQDRMRALPMYCLKSVPSHGLFWLSAFAFFQENSDSVETLHINALRHGESGKVDFSDRIRGVGRKGYMVFTCDENSESQENPLQKYQRLNAEIRELASDLESLSEKKDQEVQEDSSSYTGLSIKVEGLRDELNALQVDSLLGSSALKSLGNGDRKERDAVLANLQAAVNSESKTGDKPGDGITYEFYLKPELAKLKEGAELALLEKRVQYLEKVLEATPDKM